MLRGACLECVDPGTEYPSNVDDGAPHPMYLSFLTAGLNGMPWGCYVHKQTGSMGRAIRIMLVWSLPFTCGTDVDRLLSNARLDEVDGFVHFDLLAMCRAGKKSKLKCRMRNYAEEDDWSYGVKGYADSLVDYRTGPSVCWFLLINNVENNSSPKGSGQVDSSFYYRSVSIILPTSLCIVIIIDSIFLFRILSFFFFFLLSVFCY